MPISIIASAVVNQINSFFYSTQVAIFSGSIRVTLKNDVANHDDSG